MESQIIKKVIGQFLEERFNQMINNAGSSNGRTAGSGPANLGSNPSPAEI